MRILRIRIINHVPFVEAHVSDREKCCEEVSKILPDLVPDFGQRWHPLRFRAVSLTCLDRIESTGIDVQPTDAPFYCYGFCKALEYGGWPKVLSAFDPLVLERTFREMPIHTSQDEIERLSEDFPVKKKLGSRSWWLSRLPANGPRRTIAHEYHFARWIPGSPWDCLKLVLILTRDIVNE